MDLNDILSAREERWNLKRAYAKDEKRCVVSLTLRMPSELRLSQDGKKALSKGREEVFSLLKNAFECVLLKGEFTSSDGPYALFTVLGEGREIKKLLIRFEEESRFGDLIDADVMTEVGEEISRLLVGGSARSCLVCGEKDARVCAQNRAHTREITVQTIGDILKKRLYEGEKSCAG
ncbi:MAG: citrate lyase holo-[Clostridia bacterium]|nr:citrate lyase holo-[acyl-carrier protein] synthase [Clostridia bacterium]